MGLVSEQFALHDEAWRQEAAERARRDVVWADGAAPPKGVATLPGFLSEAALADAVAEARQKAGAAFVSQQAHDAYLSAQADPELPEGHVRNRRMLTTVASVACDELARDGALHQLYFGPTGDLLVDFVSRVVGKQLWRLDDKLGAVSINVFRPGMEHAWHFDESEYTVTLCLQKAERGGEFVYSQPIRQSADELAADQVERVMAGQAPVEALAFEPGTLSIFSGRRCLHRVAPVEGRRDRLVAVLCFASEPGVTNSATVQKQFWGRSKV